MLVGYLVGKTIPEVQASRVHTSSPTLIGLRDPSRGGRGQCHDRKAKSVDKGRHFLRDISPAGHDHGLCQRPG